MTAEKKVRQELKRMTIMMMVTTMMMITMMVTMTFS